LQSPIVPGHAVVAVSVRMECIVCCGVLPRCVELWADSGDRGCSLLVAQTCGGRRYGPYVVFMRFGRVLELADAHESALAVVSL